jgi:hypothetical protein
MSDSVTDSTIIENSEDFLIDTLTAGISDPVSSRSTKMPNSTFVVNKYSGVPLYYPCISVMVTSVNAGLALGMQTEAHVYVITAEIEVYAKKTRSKCEQLADSVINLVRTSHYGTGSAVSKNLYEPEILSSVIVTEDIDMKTGGFERLFRRIITVRYKYITGGL